MDRKCGCRSADQIRRSAVLLSVFVGAALAQPPPDDVYPLGRVTVTGSNIPRSEVESALPVQVLTREDFQRSGATTTPELMSKVSANVLGFGDQLAIGNPYNPPRAGLSSANLRGIGDGS